MMLPGSNPPADPPRPDAVPPAPAVAPPRTSRRRSSSDPGALAAPEPPGSDGAVSAGWADAVPPPRPPTLEHAVGQPREHHRREDRDELLHEVPAEAGPADGREPAEPVDHLVLLVAEDVARDGRAVPLVDRREVGPAGEEVVVVLAQGLEDGARAVRVAGVGLQAPEQGGQHGLRRRADLVGRGSHLLRDLVRREGAEDVVEGSHGGPFAEGGPAPPCAPNLAAGAAPPRGPSQDRCGASGCMIEV